MEVSKEEYEGLRLVEEEAWKYITADPERYVREGYTPLLHALRVLFDLREQEAQRDTQEG